MMYYGLLRKIETNHQRLRTETVQGDFEKLPVVGESFVIASEPLDPAATIRIVTTSVVQKIEQRGYDITFHTLNSVYGLYVLRGLPPLKSKHFDIYESQLEKVKEWEKTLPPIVPCARRPDVSEDRFWYCFLETSVGYAVTVRDKISGQELDITDYESW